MRTNGIKKVKLCALQTSCCKTAVSFSFFFLSVLLSFVFLPVYHRILNSPLPVFCLLAEIPLGGAFPPPPDKASTRKLDTSTKIGTEKGNELLTAITEQASVGIRLGSRAARV